MIPIKKTKAAIINGIIDLVSASPKSVYELSKDLGSNWDTIKDNVDILKDLKIVDTADNKIFLKQEGLVDIPKDTIAGLPLAKDIRKRTYALAKKINNEWEKKKNTPITRTHMQKALVEVAEKYPQLNIPRGWYFFGKVVLVKVDPLEFSPELDTYDFKTLNVKEKELNETIVEIINQIGALSVKDLTRCQYQKYGKKDYLIKREIEKLLLSENLDKKKFVDLLYQLIFNFRVNKDDVLNYKVLEIIKDAASVIISNLSKKEVEEQTLKTQVFEQFTSLWKVYCTYVLFSTLEGEMGYDKNIIRSIFEERIDFYTRDLNDHFMNCTLAE
ncbi:MAG: hypothetical protein V1914_01715 [archaeon]